MARRTRSSHPRFNLNYSGKSNPKDNDPKTVMLLFRYRKDENGKTILLKYSTGIKIRPKSWDSNLQLAKSGVKLPQPVTDDINAKLTKIKNFCYQFVTDNPSTTTERFKDALDELLALRGRVKDRENSDLIPYFTKYIRRSKNDYRTILKYNTVLNRLKEYCNVKKHIIYFDQINLEFKDDLESWLYKEKELSTNTASKIIQVLKQVIKDAHINGYHQNLIYQDKAFAIQRVKTSKHFLEIDELKKLAEYKDLSPTLTQARDIWLIAAYTGLRFSDFSRLRKEHIVNIDGQEVIRMNTFKGRKSKYDNEVVIPVLPELKTMLKKYEYNLPKAFSSQKMNEYIKIACEKAGLDRKVKVVKSQSGKYSETLSPLYDNITNHSARYTFINMMLNDYDISPQHLQKITGQSLSVLMGYERGDKEKNALKIARKINLKTKMVSN